VLGHADEKKKAKLSTTTPIEKEHIEYDEKANLKIEEDATPMKFKPQPVYSDMLQL